MALPRRAPSAELDDADITMLLETGEFGGARRGNAIECTLDDVYD